MRGFWIIHRQRREQRQCCFAFERQAPGGEQEPPIDLLLEQKRKLEQLNGWFDIALNNMVRGLSMFDANQRLIVCNKSYRQMYALPEELTLPGTPLADIVRKRAGEVGLLDAIAAST